METSQIKYCSTSPKATLKFADIAIGRYFVWSNHLFPSIEESMISLCTGLKIGPRSWYSFQDEKVWEITVGSSLESMYIFPLSMKEVTFELASNKKFNEALT